MRQRGERKYYKVEGATFKAKNVVRESGHLNQQKKHGKKEKCEEKTTSRKQGGRPVYSQVAKKNGRHGDLTKGGGGGRGGASILFGE